MMKHSIESHIYLKNIFTSNHPVFWTPRHGSKRIMSRQVCRNCHYQNVSLISF